MSTESRSPGAAAAWYKDAVIYQLHVRAFQDSNHDGIGDFAGLVERLDYIRDLGVTAIWLLPFYPSPLKDDGYDIADYQDVHPIYGSMRDFKALLREAHARDLRVIVELVLNHTSDRHEWFQRSRRAPAGSRWRDVYVWSDTADRYRDARIIFKDFETSNWEWDPVAGAYFWHRFYKHQPDLNYDSPLVREMVFGVLDWWMELGVDGVRLDAVPYLFEREGTTCENLPETHAFLRDLRAHLDAKFPNRMLLAEANQWPEDAAAYFGDGDECHMNFHFPLMPRLFMALQREDRFPIIDILDQTPAIPDNCQWAIFLRNHDELTLEMVTDEDRDYMYRTYAEDPRARINLGIRRRLAPLLGNDRRRIELMNSLLFSLPGTPIVYYGDEIGMGDNIYLGDRDGVRTPMQWSPDRNAGFSRTNPQRLYLPVIVDPQFHFTSVNVEAQESNPQSLLWWMRRIISLRKQFAVFGRGTIEFLLPENAKVLAFVRRFEEQVVLVVANLSRFGQFVELDLSRFRGMTPIEMFGWTHFPLVGELPYLLTLGPHACYWFLLTPSLHHAEPLSESSVPLVRVAGHWSSVVKGRAREVLEQALTELLRRSDAYRENPVQSVDLVDTIPFGGRADAPAFVLVILDVHSTADQPDRLALPVTWTTHERGARLLRESPELAVMRLTHGAGDEGLLYDATGDADAAAVWIDVMRRHRPPSGSVIRVVARKGRAHPAKRGAAGIPEREIPLSAADSTVRVLPGGVRRQEEERARYESLCFTDLVFAGEAVLQLFRRIDPGISPDYEITRFLTRAGFRHLMEIEAALELHAEGDEPATLAILKQYTPNQGTAWAHALDELGQYFERSLTPTDNHSRIAIPGPPGLFELAAEEPSPQSLDWIGPFLRDAELIGERTAEMHVALASDTSDPAFAPEPFTSYYQRGLYQAFRTSTRHMLRRLNRQLRRLPEELQPRAELVLQAEPRMLDVFRELSEARMSAQRIRCHGKWQLDKLAYTGRDFVVIEFHGDLRIPIGERRIKRSPLKDVASMLHSFNSAASVAVSGRAGGVREERASEAALREWARFWAEATGAAFLRGYLRNERCVALLPEDARQLKLLLYAYLLETAVQSLFNELRGDAPLQAGTLQRIPDLINLPVAAPR